jgi:hypothetical protein
MRILLVNDYVEQGGGADLQVKLLRDALRARGHDARVFASAAGDPPRGAADELCFGTLTALRTPLQAANPSAALRLRQALERFRPDVVHVRMFLSQLSPLILTALRTVPAVWHIVWYRAVGPRGTLLRPDGSDCEHRAGVACLREGCVSARAWVPAMLQRRLLARGVGSFDRVVAVSESMRTRLGEEGRAWICGRHTPERFLAAFRALAA